MDDPFHQAGKDAARHGVPLSSCPLLKTANMPGHTGEPFRNWRSKLASWESGWHEETQDRLAQLNKKRLLLLSD